MCTQATLRCHVEGVLAVLRVININHIAGA